jgi:hypothetical protein
MRLVRSVSAALCVLAATLAGSAATAPQASAAASCQVQFMATIGDAYLYASDRSGQFQAGMIRSTSENQVIWWQAGTPHQGPLLASLAGVTGVNKTGMVVGYEAGDSGRTTAWRYPAGQSKQVLPAPVADQSQAHAVANAINDDGWIAGTWTQIASGQELPVVWGPDGSAEGLRLPAGFTNGVATGIDADGTPIGAAYNRDASGTVTARRAVVWTGRGLYPRVLSSTDANASHRFARIAEQRSVALDEAGRLLLWDYPTTGSRVLAERVQWITAINADGSVLMGVDGIATLLLGSEQVALEMHSGATALADGDVVYGNWNANSGGAPVRWTCG